MLDLEGGGGPRPLVESPALEDAAAISPDGRRLLFVSTRDGNADIFATAFRPWDPSAAGAATNLTRHAAGDYNPAFSPDGLRVLFSSSRDTAGGDEHRRRPPGGLPGQRAVRDAGGRERRAEGSPTTRAGTGRRPGRRTGRRSSSTRSGTATLGSTASASTASTAATAPPGQSPSRFPRRAKPRLSPVPAPDGRLAFTARRDDRWTIVSTRLDGSDPRIESDAARDYWAPAYEPISGRLLAHGPGPTNSASRFEERRTGRVPDPPAARGRHAGPPRVADRHPGLSAGRRSHFGRDRHQRGVRAPRGVEGRRHRQAGGLRPDRGGSVPGSRLRLGAFLVEGRRLAGVRRRAAVRARQRGRRRLENRRPRRGGREPDPRLGLQRRVSPTSRPTAAASSSAACATATPKST